MARSQKADEFSGSLLLSWLEPVRNLAVSLQANNENLMTDVNHRRKNRKPVNQRYAESAYRNGYASPDNKTSETGASRVGRTDYLDKSMHGWGHKSELADRNVGACIPNDFTDGHRGMARAVHGAKKRARTQLRFHENAATKKLASKHAVASDDA